MEENKNCDKMAHHVSIVPCDRNGQPCLDKLSKSLPKSGKKYLCPFCTPDKYKPAWPSKVKKHLTSHDHHINLKDYRISVLACHLDCRAKKKDKHAHYHCPSCYKTLARKDGFFTHWEECKKYYSAPSDLAKDEDSGCFSCSDEDTTTENKMESKYCEESMNTVPSSQANPFDMPDVSYLSHGTHTNSVHAESVTCSEEVMMDVDVTDTVYSTEGITMNVTSPPLSTPIAESQTSFPQKADQTLTCTPVEESLITNPNLCQSTLKQIRSSLETVEENHSDFYSDNILSGVQESRHTRQDSPVSLGQDSSLTESGQYKMESDMVMCHPSLNEVMSALQQKQPKLYDEILYGFDHKGNYFGGEWQSSNDPGDSYQSGEKKVDSLNVPPNMCEVDLQVNPSYNTNIDIFNLDSFLSGNGTLGGISVHDSQDMDEIDMLKMRGQYDRIDRVELY